MPDHTRSPGKRDKTSAGPNATEVCSLCESLADDITVNTGRDEYFPDAFGKLISMDSDHRAELRCCPRCRTYFNWIDMPQMYGSGNNAEERLVRLSPEKSQLLDILFSRDTTYQPDQVELEEFVKALPLDLLVPALRFRLNRFPGSFVRFVPRLLQLLGKNNDTSLWGLLSGYVSNNPQRAEAILDSFQSNDEFAPTRLTQILHHCLRVVKNQKI